MDKHIETPTNGASAETPPPHQVLPNIKDTADRCSPCKASEEMVNRGARPQKRKRHHNHPQPSINAPLGRHPFLAVIFCRHIALLWLFCDNRVDVDVRRMLAAGAVEANFLANGRSVDAGRPRAQEAARKDRAYHSRCNNRANRNTQK